MRDVVVAGVGMARFGRYKDKTFVDHGVEAAQAALADAGLQWLDIEDAYCGACGIGGFVGNRIGQQLGLSGVPIVNVDNASASGSSAFRLAYHAVAEGRCEVAMAMGTGQIGRRMMNPLGRDEMLKMLAGGQTNAMALFALVAQRRMHCHGTPAEVFGRIAVKSHWFAARNPYAQYQKETTLEEVMAGRMIADPLTLQMCCPSGDGGAAAILTTPEWARRLGRRPLVRVRSSVMKGEFWGDSPWTMDLLTASAAKEAYDKAGVGPEDFDLVQLHDATANEELEYYEALGLCPPGEGDRLVMDGDVGPGGRIPVNTDGGLISRGHPLGPTGIAQVWETTMQLRGEAGGRQVADARLGLIQMIGAGAVCFITILERMP
jgi:acetyl-CoA acetyltransferase